MEIREPREDELRAMRELAVMSFNVPVSWIDQGPPMRPDGALCAVEGDRLLAMARDISMREWFGGQAIPCAGISGVATIPEVRGTGLGDRLMRELLDRSRARGALITTLFPATVSFYRRLGYEYAGEWTVHHADLDDLPRGGTDLTVQIFEGDDASELRDCYEDFVQGENGPVEGDVVESWWRNRVLLRWVKDAMTRTVVVRGNAGVEGYAAFELSTRGDWDGYDIACTHLVARTPGAATALLQYFRRFHGVGRGLEWLGPPNEPLGLLVAEESISVVRRFQFMSRLLDVPAALEARGYPQAVSGEAVIEVDDPLFEDNRGSFRVTAESGKVRVERTFDPGARIGVGALSAMFTAYLSPGDLIRTGAVPTRSEELAFLGALFAGPRPWMLDHF